MEKRDLVQKEEELVVAIKGLHEANEGKDLSAEDEVLFTSMVGELEDVQKQLERIVEREEVVAKAMIKKREPVNQVTVSNKPLEETMEEKNPASELGEVLKSDRYAKAFKSWLRKPDMINKVNLREGSDVDGGVLAPMAFADKLKEQLYNLTPLFGAVDKLQIGGKGITLPLLNRDSGGAQVAEGAAGTAEDFASSFGEKNFLLHKMMILWRASNELLHDSFVDLEKLMAGHFAGRLARYIENQIINGTGAQQMSGLLEDTNIDEVRCASTDAIVYADLVNVKYALKEQYRKNAVWIINKAYLKVIAKLVDSGNQPIWVMNKDQGISGGSGSMLLGLPVMESEYMPTSTSSQDDPIAILGDPKAFLAVSGPGVELARSEHESFTSDLVTFRLIQRMDGAVMDANAFVRMVRG